MTATILIFGWGNPARGDDALGPLFVDRIEALALPQVECLTDFQLQVEHALDLERRKLVLFVDASHAAEAPFDLNRLAPRSEASFGTHAVTPEAIMQVFVELNDQEPPPCYMLGIHGTEFGLGAPLSSTARENLDAACEWAKNWLPKSLDVNLSPAGELT